MINILKFPDGTLRMPDSKYVLLQNGDVISSRTGLMVVHSIVLAADAPAILRVRPGDMKPDEHEGTYYAVRAADLEPFEIVEGEDLESRKAARYKLKKDTLGFLPLGVMDLEAHWEIAQENA